MKFKKDMLVVQVSQSRKEDLYIPSGVETVLDIRINPIYQHFKIRNPSYREQQIKTEFHSEWIDSRYFIPVNKRILSIIDETKNLTNDELLEKLLEASQGDDFDGCFTNEGQFKFFYLEKLFRIKMRNFLES